MVDKSLLALLVAGNDVEPPAGTAGRPPPSTSPSSPSVGRDGALALRLRDRGPGAEHGARQRHRRADDLERFATGVVIAAVRQRRSGEVVTEVGDVFPRRRAS